MRRRFQWGRGGRVLALLGLAALVGYLWYVGLTEAAELATVLGGIASIAALGAPYLFPPGRKPAVPAAVQPTESAEVRPGASADGNSRRAVPPWPPLAAVSGAEAPEAPGHVARSNDRSARTPLTNTVMEFSDMEDPEFRRLVLRSMGERLGLGHAFSAPYSATARDHVAGIVDRIWEFKDPDAARRALVSTLEELRPDDGATVRLRSLI